MSLVRSLMEKCRDAKRRIAVWGDVMLDRWDEGSVSRICPEAPVPVLTCLGNPPVFRLGGAGNVAEQLHAWGSIRSAICGIVDEPTRQAGMFGHDWQTQRNVGPVRVPIKNRFVDYNGRLLFRADYEKMNYGLGDREIGLAREDILRQLLDGIETGYFHAVIVSDYAKGTIEAEHVADVAQACHAASIPCVINAHRSRPLEWYRAPTAFGVCNNHYWKEHNVTKHMRDVVITFGEEEPRLASDADALGDYFWLPPVLVRSVSGAGDAFTATLTVALSHGFDLVDAALVAHHAGRAYVQGEHNAVPHCRDVWRDADRDASKIFTLSELCEYLQHQDVWPHVAVANGCFDVLHPGHVALLNWAKDGRNFLVVAVNSDESVRKLRGDGRPAIPLEHRMRHLAAIGCVDAVVSFDEGTPDELLAAIAQSVKSYLYLVKGHECAGMTVPGETHVDEVMIAPDFGLPYHSSDLAAVVDYGHGQRP